MRVTKAEEQEDSVRVAPGVLEMEREVVKEAIDLVERGLGEGESVTLKAIDIEGEFEMVSTRVTDVETEGVGVRSGVGVGGKEAGGEEDAEGQSELTGVKEVAREGDPEGVVECDSLIEEVRDRLGKFVREGCGDSDEVGEAISVDDGNTVALKISDTLGEMDNDMVALGSGDTLLLRDASWDCETVEKKLLGVPLGSKEKEGLEEAESKSPLDVGSMLSDTSGDAEADETGIETAGVSDRDPEIEGSIVGGPVGSEEKDSELLGSAVFLATGLSVGLSLGSAEKLVTQLSLGEPLID